MHHSFFRLLPVTGFFLVACATVGPARPPVSATVGKTVAAPLPAARPAAPSRVAAPPAPAATTATVVPRFPGAQSGQSLADGSRLPAVQGLLLAADRSLHAGDTEAAAVDIERAQRLAPQSAAVYQRLADVRLRQKRPAEAEQLARKGLAFAASAAQQAVFWRQIAAARQQQGLLQSAQEAQARAAALEGAAAP